MRRDDLTPEMLDQRAAVAASLAQAQALAEEADRLRRALMPQHARSGWSLPFFRN